MSDEDIENKCKECDDPCDDCTDQDMSNLTGWITLHNDRKELDNNNK